MESENNSEGNKEEINNNKDDFEGIFPDNMLEAIPIEDRGKFVSIFKQSMISSVMSKSNPISEKITSEHITKLIEKSENQDKRDRDERKSKRNYNLLILIISIFFLGFLIVFLKDDKELLYKIIIAIIAFIGGFGIGKTTKSKEED